MISSRECPACGEIADYRVDKGETFERHYESATRICNSSGGVFIHYGTDLPSSTAFHIETEEGEWEDEEVRKFISSFDEDDESESLGERMRERFQVV